jgi:hypothetical protein
MCRSSSGENATDDPIISSVISMYCEYNMRKPASRRLSLMHASP